MLNFPFIISPFFGAESWKKILKTLGFEPCTCRLEFAFVEDGSISRYM